MTTADIICKEDVEEMIVESLDYTIEDFGIGHYEYGDGNYVDSRPYLALTTTSVVIQYPDNPEQVIYTTLKSWVCQSEGEIEYLADLSEVKWDGSTKKYVAEYSIMQV